MGPSVGLTWPPMERPDELTLHGGSRDDQVIPQASQEKADLEMNKARGFEDPDEE